MMMLDIVNRRTFLRTSAAAAGLLIATVAGCATEKLQLRKVYDGAELGQDRVAIVRSGELRGPLNERAQWVRFMAVDGKPLDGGWDGELAILPGPHTLRLRFATGSSGAPATSALEVMVVEGTKGSIAPRTQADLSFEALAGHSYIVKYKAGFMLKEKPVTYWIEDEASGAVVAGTKPGP
jgi:hypothetical protein